MMNNVSYRTSLVLFLSLTALSCRMIARGDSVSLQNTQNLKQETDSVLQNPTATTESQLQSDLKTQEVYVAKTSSNDLIIQQWRILDNSQGHSLGQLLVRLQSGAAISKVELQNRQALIDQEFDQIIKLEQDKITRLAATPAAN
jgi:hypothetical protein